VDAAGPASGGNRRGAQAGAALPSAEATGNVHRSAFHKVALYLQQFKLLVICCFQGILFEET